MSFEYNINTRKDFEILWVDINTHQLRDLNNVTFEVYHYQCARPGVLVAPAKEPYVITEGLTDIFDIGSFYNATDFIDRDVTIDFSIIANDLGSLGCPPNNYVVCSTNSKMAIVNGYKKASLSACELAALINIGSNNESATGYTATAKDGFLILKGIFVGSTTRIQVGSGNMNPILGLHTGDLDNGDDVKLVQDIYPSPMIRISTGRYVCPGVLLSVPPYRLEEKYYVVYKGFDPVTLRPELSEEDFILISGKNNDLIYSFGG